MDITVRNWTKKDLEAVKNGNKWLATLLMNAQSYNADMMAVRSQLEVKVYVLYWEDGTTIRVNASDDFQLQKLISNNYATEPIEVYEEQIVTREVHSSIQKIS